MTTSRRLQLSRCKMTITYGRQPHPTKAAKRKAVSRAGGPSGPSKRQKVEPTDAGIDNNYPDLPELPASAAPQGSTNSTNSTLIVSDDDDGFDDNTDAHSPPETATSVPPTPPSRSARKFP